MAKVRRTTILMPTRMPAPSKAAKTSSKTTAEAPKTLPVVGKAPKG